MNVELRKKLDNYRIEYEAKQEKFFSCGGIKSAKYFNCANELYAMSAHLFGMEEQLYYLDKLVNEKDRIDFVNNLGELQLSNDTVEKLYKQGDYRCFVDHFKIDTLNNSMMMSIIVKNAKQFTKVLAQFINKRNAYRKRPKCMLLDEVFYLKTILIKHYCIMEKIANYK
ncbi:PKIP [Buzura suppressaria nucleopolyhedrovirus]|uniref:PKIP n=1 Tax=Buzura suppressaria nuclear polyhedrosis virus TaxID=74320 RepID=W5VSD3_NPVBS|nr:PKIP [Buzura suppressaria nucleopolyhedrovirus]AHH82692.1 PKIP [Buzura suppressaria nucleopolyhedrovirus]AKN91076.1 PKIPc [Buzura suppressaria nucleopolyhedrovirus]QYF10646.1 protein kinase interacting factor [Buzura suppressaria nucleopolyhedrovirus]